MPNNTIDRKLMARLQVLKARIVDIENGSETQT